MNVYVLILDIPYEGEQIQSIHSTGEYAKIAKDNHKANKDIMVSLKIEEWELDEK